MMNLTVPIRNPFLTVLKSTIILLLLCYSLQSHAELRRAPLNLAPQIGLFDVYEQNRKDNIPNYITTDFLLLSYSLLKVKNNEIFEQNVLIPLFNQWLSALEKAIPNNEQKQSVSNHELVSLLAALANGTPPLKSDAVKQEWDLITSSSLVQVSPLLHRTLDYTSFKPIGRYAQDEKARQFYRAFRYASSVLFPLLSSNATGISSADADSLFLQAQQIAKLSQENQELNKAYTELTSLLEKRFGAAGDLSWSIFENISGKNTSTSEGLSTAEIRTRIFSNKGNLIKKPSVISDVVDVSLLEKNATIADVVTGWRLIPSFSTPVSNAFQQLIFPNTQTYNGPNTQSPFTSGIVAGQKVKTFPRGLEILALLGDEDAYKQLKSELDTAYLGYDASFLQSKMLLADASGFAQQHLAIVKKISSQLQRPESALAFWTLQRYVDQLYIKQSTTPTGKGIAFSMERAGAQLEPAVELTAMLNALVQSEIKINPSPSWLRFSELIQSLTDLQWKLSLGIEFSTEDEELLNDLDTTVLALTGKKDSPILVPVHSNPSSNERLWEATGLAQTTIYKEARGAFFSHHEIVLSLDKTMDNAAWLKQLMQ